MLGSRVNPKLKSMLDHRAQLMKNQPEPAKRIKALQILAEEINNTKLIPENEICAFVATYLTPILDSLGIKKGERWYRKYLDAKYKRPQQKEKSVREKKDPAVKATEAVVAKAEEKATSKAKVEDDAGAIIPFAKLKVESGVGFVYPWSRVPGKMLCENPACHHNHDNHTMFAKKGQHQRLVPTCKCKDYVVDMRKLQTPDRAQPSKKAKPASKPRKVAADKIRDGGSATAPIKQVERDQKQGYEAYPGDASKMLDQPHISEKKYNVHEIMATPIYTYDFDPVDKKSNTKVCGNCGSSKLDWTKIVMRKWDKDEAAKYLKEARVGGRDMCPNIGFFQCNTCHAFLISESDVPHVTIEKQEDGSYRLKVSDPLLQDSPKIQATAIIDLDMLPGKLATQSHILEVLLTGPKLAKDHPLCSTQVALHMWKEDADHQRKLVKDLYTQIDTAKVENEKLTKELATRYSKEEGAKFEAIMTANEEYKAENQRLKSQLATASITTADKLQSFDIFMPRKMVLELTKAIDALNWNKKLPGLVYTTDGKFVQKIKAGVPE